MPVHATAYKSTSEQIAIHKKLKETFEAGVTLPLNHRRQQLLQVARMVQDNEHAINAAVHADLGRNKLEVALLETGTIVSAALRAADSLVKWTAPEKPVVESWQASWDATIYSAPKGTVLIIAPWNFPFVITLLPLIGAIAAGCTVVMKPSEFASNMAGLLEQLVADYLDPSAYVVVNGGELETIHLLSLQWDHIFFTGSKRVGSLIAAAAAKFVTPMTLELGTKSPVYVDIANADLDMCARRILFGKQINAGQVCVSPDYVLVPRELQDDLAAALVKACQQFWPNGTLGSSSDFSKIINANHKARLEQLLHDTKSEKVIGGQSDDERIEMTIYKNVSLNDVLMDGEIFGPILPVVPVDNLDHALRIIRGIDIPLVTYVFTEDEAVKEQFLNRSASGSLIFNETAGQLGVHEIPFGGQGASGYGSYLGKFSFDTFTHRRGSINVPPAADQVFQYRNPPYSEAAYDIFAAKIHSHIPTQ